MKLSHAMWFAFDLLPVNNIDKAAKELAKEVIRLRAKHAEPEVKPTMPPLDGTFNANEIEVRT